MLHFDPSGSCLYASFRPECCLPLVPVGFGPSKQLLGRDFSLSYDGGESGRGKSEKGEEWDRTRGDQTERIGGWMRRRNRVEDRTSSL